ncbi:MAG: alcohol dehydrogenase catalytic domain-containing protein [Woeseiaceae bacterium]
MLINKIVSMQDCEAPLVRADVPRPNPAADEVLLRVSACGVCHTELDEIEGRAPPPVLPVIPGHEVVGRIVEIGNAVTQHAVGDRVGVGWIFNSSGDTDENISEQFVATGRDANGGYAEFMTVSERYAYRIPGNLADEQVAPLLCAGSVGYRALITTGINNGNILGLTGFGGSGHLVLQLAKFIYSASPVYVFARSSEERQFALELGADWVGDTTDQPPQPPHAIIDTTPAWLPVLAALKCLRPGGRLVINAIRKESDDKSVLAEIDYADHLWREKQLVTVANVTARDIRSCLDIAAQAGIKPRVETYKLDDANTALAELRSSHVRGAKVLKMT